MQGIETHIFSSKKFTLLELLIVIAIIAILLSLLLPSLSQAREKAKQVYCLSNGRSISGGMMLHSKDFDGVFAHNFKSNRWNSEDWALGVDKYIGGGMDISMNPFHFQKSKMPEVWYGCPTTDKPDNLTAYNIDYGIPGQATVSPYSYIGYKMHDISFSSQSVMLVDCFYYKNPNRGRSTFRLNKYMDTTGVTHGVTKHPRNKQNYIFFDGAAQIKPWVNQSEFISEYARDLFLLPNRGISRNDITYTE